MSGKTIYNCKLHDQSPTFFIENQISDSFFGKSETLLS